MGMDTINNPQLVRDNLWSTELKDILQEELFMDAKVRWITDFPDGDIVNIPTLSEMTVRNYSEGAQITLDDPSTGNFTLNIDKYYQTGFKIPEKFKHDSFYVAQAESNFVSKLLRAIMEQKESDIANLQSDQTASNPNTIQGVDHRYVGTGTSEALVTEDIQKAKLALDKANVSKMGRVAVLDPLMVYQLLQEEQFVYQDRYGPNDHIKEGLGTDIKVGRLAGFDLLESNLLDNSIAESITATGPGAGALSVTGGYANMCIGEDAFVGAMRAEPDLRSWYDDNTRSDVHHATIRYGVKLFRPESLVTILAE